MATNEKNEKNDKSEKNDKIEKREKPKEKKEVRRVEVEINGISYALRTTESEEYVKSLAKMVDEKMRMVSMSTGSFASTRMAVIAALDLADEYTKLKKDYDELMTLIDEK